MRFESPGKSWENTAMERSLLPVERFVLLIASILLFLVGQNLSPCSASILFYIAIPSEPDSAICIASTLVPSEPESFLCRWYLLKESPKPPSL